MPGCLVSLPHLLRPAQRARKIPPRGRTTGSVAAFPRRRRMRGCLRTPTDLLHIPLCPGHHRESPGEGGWDKKSPTGRSCPVRDGEELERCLVVSRKTTLHWPLSSLSSSTLNLSGTPVVFNLTFSIRKTCCVHLWIIDAS